MNKSPRFIILLLLVTGAVFAVSPRYRRYTVSQKKAMKEKQAIISTRLGRIVIEFFPDAAPNHVANFIELTKKGFYNKTTFHRVIPRFMFRAGTPSQKALPAIFTVPAVPGITSKRSLIRSRTNGGLCRWPARSIRTAPGPSFLYASRTRPLSTANTRFLDVSLRG